MTERIGAPSPTASAAVSIDLNHSLGRFSRRTGHSLSVDSIVTILRNGIDKDFKSKLTEDQMRAAAEYILTLAKKDVPYLVLLACPVMHLLHRHHGGHHRTTADTTVGKENRT